jgi:hypothetical protein
MDSRSFSWFLVGFLWVYLWFIAGFTLFIAVYCGFRLCSACFVGFVVLKLGNCAEMAVHGVVLALLQALLAVTFAVFWGIPLFESILIHRARKQFCGTKSNLY